MSEARLDTLTLARQLRRELAGRSLPPRFAKLYSQHTRLRAGRPSLSGWRPGEFDDRLYDAFRLISATLVEQENGRTEETDGLRRAGEILEWLSHDELNTQGLPVQLIASAAYQLAGYPARAAGLLNAAPNSDGQSRIVGAFLKADFRGLFQELARFWTDHLIHASSTDQQVDASPIASQERLESWIITETASALGVLCSEMRWGNEWRVSAALLKLTSASKVLLHSRDPYSWLLAKLCAEVMSAYSLTSVRKYTAKLAGSVDRNSGQAALEGYARHCYAYSRALVWPSQAKGITRLAERDSFALCTPTGSGKTAVAELAILQSLFLAHVDSDKPETSSTRPQPMVIYLVPTRALAVEVEAKLSRVLAGLTDEKVIVTGLYGGYDWGPTDAWLTAQDKTILICTFEKAEALMRFLGPLFLGRVTLIVIDEAHSVQFDNQVESLRRGENRSLRLESLGMRVMAYLEQGKGRAIALSAVSTGAENVLSNWISGTAESQPVTTPYRSTRQLVGRLICMPSGSSEIRYDLLDNARLTFDLNSDNPDETPYIPNPFPECPFIGSWNSEGPEKRVRPHLLWAAMHIARQDRPGGQAGVLISVTQGITGYAEDFLRLLDGPWAAIQLPMFFQTPSDARKMEIWHQCLESCVDYFGIDSCEYQLLQKGIVLHHGKMPGLLARLLIQAIQERIFNIVVATSTLSEGVNLPFETILIPTLRRSMGSIDFREFANLVGRAGRPGFGTEGTSLVLIPVSYSGDKSKTAIARAEENYHELITYPQQAGGPDSELPVGANAKSPLAELLTTLEQHWRRISNSNSRQEFLRWLEVTAPVETKLDSANPDLTSAVEALDTLDSVLLSSIVEAEQLEHQELSLDELEQRLQRIWQRSYAHFASKLESSLMAVWLGRGRALKRTVYPIPSIRRRLYRTSLPPRSGTALLELYPKLRQHLETGWDYAIWSQVQRLEYVKHAVQQLGTISHFAPKAKAGPQKVNWEDVLSWWLSPTTTSVRPDRAHISNWHAYVSSVFIYRFNWGLGSFIALAMDDTYGGELHAPSLEDWPRTGLPWIVFWLKELVTWGTLEPAATYLLSRRLEVSRADAERGAAGYHARSALLAPNDQLNASTIRRWAESLQSSTEAAAGITPPQNIEVTLLRDFGVVPNRAWRVVPLEHGEELIWIDPAGFPLAQCQRVADWRTVFLSEFDFRLDTEKSVVTWEKYL
jgi:hypothetical protein